MLAIGGLASQGGVGEFEQHIGVARLVEAAPTGEALAAKELQRFLPDQRPAGR
jgi:hypothetical protein